MRGHEVEALSRNHAFKKFGSKALWLAKIQGNREEQNGRKK